MLAAEAFSPHETHFCLVGIGIGLVGFVRVLRGLTLLGIGGLLFVDLASGRTGFRKALDTSSVVCLLSRKLG